MASDTANPTHLYPFNKPHFNMYINKTSGDVEFGIFNNKFYFLCVIYEVMLVSVTVT